MDPIAGAGVAKAAAAAGEESGKLLGRVLGPAADEIGEALGRYTKFRMRNVGRIVEKADKKSSGAGEVPPRLAHKLLEDGSYCDDELMAEYLSGVLAGGRTPDGRDDRAIVWSNLVTSMSTMQLRAHFVLYREWAARLQPSDDVYLANRTSRKKTQMVVDTKEFSRAIVQDLDIRLDNAVNHAIFGLARLELIGPDYYSGTPEQHPKRPTPFPNNLGVYMSPSGMELYGWAQGDAEIIAANFIERSAPFGEDVLPRLHSVRLPDLDA